MRTRISMAKHCGNYTGSTANRGVEAKEVEITNTRLDRNTNTSSCTSLPGEGSAADSSTQTTLPMLDATGSYVQVVVQKHRARAPAAAAQTSPRLPAASSPIRQSEEGAGDVLLLPASVLLACARPALAHQRSLPLHNTPGDAASRADAATSATGEALTPLDAEPLCSEQQKTKKDWKSFNNATDKLDLSENGGCGPERVEVYYFERCGGAFLATSAGGGGRVTRVERAGRRARVAAAALLAEALAAAHLLLALPIALLIGVQRCVLRAARDLVTGSVQTAADYALKPALALAFNAGVGPALACAAQAAGALRDALRPLWLAAGDALDAPARALARLSLVSVRLDACPRCRCAAHHV